MQGAGGGCRVGCGARVRGAGQGQGRHFIRQSNNPIKFFVPFRVFSLLKMGYGRWRKISSLGLQSPKQSRGGHGSGRSPALLQVRLKRYGA